MKLKYRQFGIFVMLSYMLIECSPGSEKDVINQISSLTGVVEVNGVFGKYDIFVKVASENPDLMEIGGSIILNTNPQIAKIVYVGETEILEISIMNAEIIDNCFFCLQSKDN